MMVFGLFVPASSVKQKIENLPHRAAQVFLSRNCRFPGATGSHLSRMGEAACSTNYNALELIRSSALKTVFEVR